MAKKYTKKQGKEVSIKKTYKELLQEVLTLDGQLSDCFRYFHNYSFINQMYAIGQAGHQPINTYKGWLTLGRQVKKGGKAISLRMPVIIKDKDETDENGKPLEKMVFIFRKNWFGISETEGEEYKLPELPEFDKNKAFESLDIQEVPFAHNNGNVQGYASGRKIAINPVATQPLETIFHEVAHILLEHTDRTKNPDLTRSLKETEAETVAYILCNLYNLTENLSSSRAYVQGWNKGQGITEESSKRIFKTVDQILKAGKN